MGQLIILLFKAEIIKMKKLFLTFIVFQSLSALATPSGDLALNAHSLKLKVYKLAVSTSANCTSPVTVIDNGSSPQEVDVKAPNPQFGSGRITDGTYPCVMLEISDTIKYSGQASSSGNCSPSSETSRDLCRLDNGGSTQLLDGSTFTCTNSEDHVVLYLSTNTLSNASGNGFVPPVGAGSNDGGYLANALIVTGSAIGRLDVNTDGYLCDDDNDTGSDCDGAGASATGTSACRLEGAEFRKKPLKREALKFQFIDIGLS
jgi:hypothetical protein